MIRRKRKYWFKDELKNIPKDNLKRYLHDMVFSTPEFNLNVKQTAQNLNIDEKIAYDVLVSYFTNIALVINTVRKIKTKINIYGFFSITVEKGRRI